MSATTQATRLRDPISFVTQPPELSILLVNWNTSQMTLECLASIYAETARTTFEVIVSDYASSDGAADAIREAFPHGRLIEESENHGFGRATNIQGETGAGWKAVPAQHR